MPFKAILEQLVEITPGASGAILADWEGEAVEQCCLYDDFELKVIGAHKGIILNQMKEIHGRVPAGTLHEAVVTTVTQHLVIGAVGPDYSLVMTLEREALVTKALYHFRKTVQRLEREIY